MKIMLVISYDGSKFFGFQRQNSKRSVQKDLETALSTLYEKELKVKGAGRTDAGVHARYQVVHFETEKYINCLKSKLNNILEDIKVKKVKIVDNDFHSRYDVKNKIYVYKIDLSNTRDNNYYLVLNYKLNIKKMRHASKLFLGTHNFESFVSGYRDNYISTIIDIKIYKLNNVVYLKFKGYGFYRYMVRNLVGALIEIGKGKIKEDLIQEMLNNETKKRLPTSSPNGLYLYKINY